jgi:hypothetical protein
MRRCGNVSPEMNFRETGKAAMNNQEQSWSGR